MFVLFILNSSLCDKHPEFIKYFSKGSRLPLNIDARMTAKFTLIWETLGYIILDCYDKPKQLDKLTGYSAMVHKDMRLNLHDFLVSSKITFTGLFVYFKIEKLIHVII